MRIAFISDIHGNAVALEAVLRDIENQAVDEIVVLGDIAYRGPEPQKAIERVRERATAVLKGNADAWMERGVRKGEVPDGVLEMMNHERDWARERVSDEAVSYLKNLPAEWHRTVEGVEIHAFHARRTVFLTSCCRTKRRSCCSKN